MLEFCHLALAHLVLEREFLHVYSHEAGLHQERATLFAGYDVEDHVLESENDRIRNSGYITCHACMEGVFYRDLGKGHVSFALL